MRGIRAPSSWKKRCLELEFNYTKDGKNLIACFVKPDQIPFPGVFPSFRKNGKNHCPVPFEVQSAVIIGGRPGLNSEPQNRRVTNRRISKDGIAPLCPLGQ